MNDSKTVLITGASGNLGGKLRQRLQGRYPLRLLDIDPKGDTEIVQTDLSQWDQTWIDQFKGVDTVVHLAANPAAVQTWQSVVAPNIDALINMYTAAAQTGVKRVIFASSNHVMGEYKDDPEPPVLTTDIPVRPGTHYSRDGKAVDSIAYGGAKLVGERLGKCYNDIYGLSVIAVRIGWVQRGENKGEDVPLNMSTWGPLMWLSNRDYCQLMERCIEADAAIDFAIINGMSGNSSMRWDLEYARKLVGYEPQDDVTQYRNL